MAEARTAKARNPARKTPARLSNASTSARRRPVRASWALLLALVTLLAYLPVARDGFINYDDQDYVTENRVVQNGLTWAGVQWAFTTGHASNWHPVTWLSHMLDCELFGLNAGAHHFVNVLFHAANAVLLLLLLFRLTGALWPSAFVAALFAWHPLHVESVAWISERKDVLSTFFALLTLLAYTRYAQGRRESRVESRAQKQRSGSRSQRFNVSTIPWPWVSSPSASWPNRCW